ncbi:MAG: glycosyltransferase [Chthoniobacterales bacterium]
MKICDLTQFYSPVSGGVKRYIEQKVAYIERRSPEDRHILVIPGEKTSSEKRGNSQVYTIESPLVSKTSRYRMLLNLCAVEEILEAEKPDIAESGDPYQLAWKAIVSGRALGIPIVGFYHSHFPEAYIRSVAKYFGSISVQIAEEISRRYVRSLYNHFERTMVPSPALAALLTEWGVESVENIDLGVSVETFFPDDSRAKNTRNELGIPQDAFLLVYAGRLASEKNVRTLFSAFELLNDTKKSFHLLCIGDGTQRSLLRKLQKNSSKVHWLPYCSDAKRLADLYRTADLFVHPGVQETFGLVSLESQACGTPVVGIRGSYMDRIIYNGQMEWASENTPQALARAIEETAETNTREAGERASKLVRERYSWDHVFDRLFSVYRSVIADYKN